MKSIIRKINAISEWTGNIIMFLVLFIVGIVLYEVIARYVFNSPTVWSHESCQFLFGFYFLLGGAYALRYGAHVNMDILYNRLSLRGRAILDMVTFAFFLIFCGVLLWQGTEAAFESIQVMERSQSLWGPPKYFLKVPIAIGALLMLVQGIAKFIADLHIACSGKPLE